MKIAPGGKEGFVRVVVEESVEESHVVRGLSLWQGFKLATGIYEPGGTKSVSVSRNNLPKIAGRFMSVATQEALDGYHETAAGFRDMANTVLGYADVQTDFVATQALDYDPAAHNVAALVEHG